MSTNPQTGEMFACQTCNAQIQIVLPCDCDSPCCDFRCCGDPMKNITEPSVRNSSDTEVMDGYENSPNHETISMPTESIAEQAEKAKKV